MCFLVVSTHFFINENYNPFIHVSINSSLGNQAVSFSEYNYFQEMEKPIFPGDYRSCILQFQKILIRQDEDQYSFRVTPNLQTVY